MEVTTDYYKLTAQKADPWKRTSAALRRHPFWLRKIYR